MEDILHMAEMNAMERRLSDLRCQDIMTPQRAHRGVRHRSAGRLGLMRTHRVKALPVVDRQRRIIGIISLARFHAARRCGPELRGARSPASADPPLSRTVHTNKPEAVGQIMMHQRARRQRRPVRGRAHADLHGARPPSHPHHRCATTGSSGSSRSRISCVRSIGPAVYNGRRDSTGGSLGSDQTGQSPGPGRTHSGIRRQSR